MDAQTPRRKPRLPYRWLLVLLGALLLGLWLWQRQSAPVAVAVEQLSPGPVALVLALNGRSTAESMVEIKPAVTAIAEAVLVAEGESVTKGQLLIRLDPNLVEAQRDQAEAALRVQEARRDQAASAARRAAELGANALSKSDLETAQLALATATGEVVRLQAALAEVERQLARYQLSAPLAGVVLERNVDPGQLVGPQESLLLIADPAAPIVETDVDERYASRIAVGQKALLRPVGLDETYTGEIRYLAPRIDLSTGGRKVEIRFDTAVTLPLGLTISTNIIVEDLTEALTLPRAALRQDGGVLVVEDGRALARHVSYIDWPAERVVITQGLQSGALVITDPGTLAPGARVAAKLQPLPASGNAADSATETSTGSSTKTATATAASPASATDSSPAASSGTAATTGPSAAPAAAQAE